MYIGFKNYSPFIHPLLGMLNVYGSKLVILFYASSFGAHFSDQKQVVIIFQVMTYTVALSMVCFAQQSLIFTDRIVPKLAFDFGSTLVTIIGMKILDYLPSQKSSVKVDKGRHDD